LIKDTLCIDLRVDPVLGGLGVRLTPQLVDPIDGLGAGVGRRKHHVEHGEDAGAHEGDHHETGHGQSNPLEELDHGQRDERHAVTIAERPPRRGLRTIAA
jgi:hypothetical protein